MTDWAKVLIGTIAGFLFGLLAEPIKFWMSNSLKQQQARKVLYSEFARVLAGLDRLQRLATEFENIETLSEEQEETAKECIKEFQQIMTVDLFDYYYEKEKPLYYDMKDASHLRGFYLRIKREISRITGEHDNVRDQLNSFPVLWAANRVSCAADSIFDHELLDKLRNDHAKRLKLFNEEMTAASGIPETIGRYMEEFPGSSPSGRDIQRWLLRKRSGRK